MLVKKYLCPSIVGDPPLFRQCDNAISQTSFSGVPDMGRADTLQRPPAAETTQVPEGTDLIEWYYERGCSDGLPLVPPTPEKIAAVVAALGGEPGRLLARVPPRWGSLTREVLAINMVMAGCRPEYAPVVEAAMLALCDDALQPERRAGHDAHGKPAAGGERAGAQGDRHERRLQRVRLGQPRQRHDRPRAAARAAQRRRRLAGAARQEHARPSRQVHLLHRRERGSEPVRALSRGTRLPGGGLHRVSCWPPSRRTASPTISRTTRRGYSTASAPR